MYEGQGAGLSWNGNPAPRGGGRSPCLVNKSYKTIHLHNVSSICVLAGKTLETTTDTKVLLSLGCGKIHDSYFPSKPLLCFQIFYGEDALLYENI